MIFIKLLLAHLLGDFVFQTRRMVIHKEARKIASPFLYLHIGLHMALILIVCWDVTMWKTALIIAVSHWLIDLLKLYSEPFFKQRNLAFFLDQALHLLVLYVVAFWGNLQEHTLEWVETLDWNLLTGLVFVTFPSAIIISKLLERMSDQIALDHKSLPNAGKYIGILERLFVFLFIIMDRWEAIGLLIAAKSVFRFNDLKETNNRKLTEYILIGTLLSFAFAILAGLAVGSL